MARIKVLTLAVIIFFTGCSVLQAQTRPQIRFKIGPLKNIVKPGSSNSYAYMLSSPQLVNAYSIALEFSKSIKNSSLSWFSGVALDPQVVDISMNRKNFQSVTSDPTVTVSESTFRFYGGLGKSVNKKAGGGISVFSGFGLAVSFSDQGGGIGKSATSEGVTKKGEYFKSPYTVWPLGAGYDMWVYVAREFRVTPTVLAGIRWQRVNRKGNSAVGIELLGNYGLTPYFTYRIPYTLNGIPHEDRLDEQGICAQLNLLIPIYNFGKRKKL